MNTDTTNPYVGLRPFNVNESILFFGRNEQTTELLQRLHQHHFVAVVGSSGSGKSSLIKAGLIPALKAGYLVDDSDQWFIAIMKPGQSPLYNLAEAVLEQVNAHSDPTAVAALVKQIEEEGADVLLSLFETIRNQNNTNFFLLVDQFEELFRFAMEQKDVARKDEAIDFVNIMLELAQQKQVPIYIVITMRTDFIGDCVQFYGLPEAMNQSQYLVPRMNRVQLKTVIEGPAKLYGGKLDPALTSKLLNELGKVKDELPLLQHALMRMWEFEMKVNRSGALDLEDYQSIGGIEKALSKHADEALAGMDEEELRITKEIFQALTSIDENGRKIRRPVLLSQLKELTGGTEEQILKIIDLFIADRRSFLMVSNAGDTGDKIIDISHESLIRQWNSLCTWVDEEGESAALYLQLAAATKLNQKNKKDFLTGSELQIALEWRDHFKPTALWANRYKEGFEDCLQYLGNSEQDWLLNLKKLKVRKRNTLVLIFLIIALAAVAGFQQFRQAKTDAKLASNAAILAKKEAYEDSIKAVQANEDAEKSKLVIEEIKNVYKSDSQILKKINVIEQKNSVPTIKPRIYVHYNDESSKPEMDKLSESLKANGYILPGLDKVEYSIDPPQLKYFKAAEEEKAKEVLERLKALGYDNVKLVYVRGNENNKGIRPYHFELWFK